MILFLSTLMLASVLWGPFWLQATVAVLLVLACFKEGV